MITITITTTLRKCNTVQTVCNLTVKGALPVQNVDLVELQFLHGRCGTLSVQKRHNDNGVVTDGQIPLQEGIAELQRGAVCARVGLRKEPRRLGVDPDVDVVGGRVVSYLEAVR